jgi:hypothetical protein
VSYNLQMPSPRGTNYERLYISAHRGPAYDSRRGLGYDAQPSNACQVADRLVNMLSQDELADLGREVIKARDAKRGASDEEADASLDPNKTAAGVNWTLQRKKQLNGAQDARRRRVAQDAKFASVLKQAFARPGSATYDARERRKLAADASVTKSLADRYPGFGAIVVHAEEVDRHARPHSLAIDERRVASLAERYPGFGSIGFAR